MSGLDTLRTVCQITVGVSVLMLVFLVIFAYKKEKQGKDVQVLTTVLGGFLGLICLVSMIGMAIVS